MYCKKCGNEVNDSAAFCKKCGYRFQTGDKPAEVQARASVKASVSPSPVRVKPAAAEAVGAGVKPRARVNKYFVIGLAAILVVVAAVVLIVNFVVKATKSDEDIIIEAFKNTFGADSYKYTLKCNPIYEDEGYDKDSQYISYVEKASDKDETVMYIENCNKKEGYDDSYYKSVYINGKWYNDYNGDFVESELTDKEKKIKKKELNNYYYVVGDDGTTTLYNVVTPNASSALGTMLEKYFQKGKLDCVKEYTKKDNKYFFKLDYSTLVKSLDVDYGKSVRHNVVKMYSHFEDSDKIKYTLNIEFTVNKDNLKNMNAVLIAEYKNEYVKLAKWNFEFKNIGNLKVEDCKASNVQVFTQYEVDSRRIQEANENARVAYEFLMTSNPNDVSIKEYGGYVFHLGEYAEDKEYYDNERDDYSVGTDNYYYYNTIGKLYKVMSKKENDENIGEVSFDIEEIDGKEQYFVQWKNNDIIGQYPNPTDPDDNVEWGVYNPN